MKKFKVTLTPVTQYVIGQSVPCEKKVEFNYGLYPTKKFVPISSIKGLLRTAAVYSQGENSCEFVTSRICRGDEDLVRTCSDIQDMFENLSPASQQCRESLKEYRDKFSSPCIVCRVFGNGKVRGKMRILGDNVEIKNLREVGNLRFSYNFLESRHPKYEGLKVEASNAKVEFEVLCSDHECEKLLREAIKVINNGLVRLGRFKSRGFGIVKASLTEVTSR
ncbi:RAMP superfamily CRISPR-associated protein [Metallosphaera hakonensis]|uniref:CRISPR type III-associated protein domain-containing protein n=1 Tax=Metallosphaera hakonensis JCM 8857 = DSM 7519 TaxID=1293036 RepID=A0A2U9IR45_9CREN|nr:RAMP superfamily CRISPR-associated protein [Metallosphaera hakonensis]AWR98456.1 hypothetical protein DFR87_00590 [Metallosphaera hakonensis JCM 8857 = DSM 7519]